MKNHDKVNNSFLQSETKRDLLILLLLSAALKISLSLFIKVINYDGVLYIAAAQKFAAGYFREGLSFHPMPVFSLAIALVHYLIPNWVVAARLISLTSSVLTVVPLYLLTLDLFDRKAAIWSCVAFTLLPLSNHLSVEVMRDPSFLFFLSWATYFAHRSINCKNLLFFLLASLFFSLSVLFRIEGVVCYVSYILFLFYLVLRKPQERFALLKGILICLAFPIPLLVLSSAIFGEGWSSFNKLSLITNELRGFLNLRFLDNYKFIYQQLKILETTLPRAYEATGQGFTEIARHYLYAIYLIGLFEIFIKALFPLYLIPLVLGLKNSKIQNRAFVLFLVCCYLLTLYYSLIKMDTTRVRFFLAPAFVLFPWIGVGIERISAYVKGFSRPRLLIVVLALFLGIPPLYKSAKIIWKQDTILIEAGKWIAQIPEVKKVQIHTTDIRIPFYADLGGYFPPYLGSDYLAMERLALVRGAELLIIKTSIKEETPRPELKHFKKIKEFMGVKNIVSVYCSPVFYRVIKLRGFRG